MTTPISIDAALQQASDDLHTTQQKAQAVLDAALVMITAATDFINKLDPKWPLTKPEA
jgi:hypothetical protein